MKTIIKFVMFCVLCSAFFSSASAQEVDNPQEAFANMNWYLIKVVMDGEEHPFVPTGSIPNGLLKTMELVTYNDNLRCYFMANYCEMCGTDAYFLSATEFKIIGWGACMAYNNCMSNNDPDVFEFSHLYESVFWNRNDAADNEESFYEINITETDGNLSMIITKDNGNQAFYGDETLSIPSLEKNEITLYPNPVKDLLYIENISEPVEMEIYDLSGKVLLRQEVNETAKQVNVSQLSKGMYFYGLSQNGKTIKTGKLMKN